MALIPISELPEDVTLSAATDLCYADECRRTVDALCSYQSVLLECDKLLVPHLLRSIRRELRLRSGAPQMTIVDHRAELAGEGPIGATVKAFRAAVAQLVEAIKGGQSENNVVVIPNFDLMVSGDQTGQHLDMLTREIMVVLYENPNLRVLAFKDPNLSIPRTVREFFPRRVDVFGIRREHLPQLITRTEARRLDTRNLDVYRLYKYTSGLNVAKLRQLLEGLADPRFTDGNPSAVYRELREATIEDSDAELPNVPLEDLGGYAGVKQHIRENILNVLQAIEERSTQITEEQTERLERLIPRNILFTGPPGTGKTLFCKALATELNATVIIVSGPELKSKWVGESEERIRKVFAKARKCAPSIVIFDEIDSFARKRGGGATPGSSGQAANQSEHSMVNQLLTEMEGFRSQEAVFIVATTNFANALDDALLSRFRYHVEVPYPKRDDRAAILDVYDRKYALGLDAEVRESLLDGTEAWIDTASWTKFAGRDLETVCAALGRSKLLAEVQGESSEVTQVMAERAVAERIRTPYRGIGFADIGGYAEVKAKLKSEILEMLVLAKHQQGSEREHIERMIPKGVIFEGPPGTGKTLFAKALASELGAAVSIVNGPELKSVWHGESERQIRELFAQARRNAPSVLVFDEIDSIAGQRGSGSGGSVDHSMVNQLLTEMDGFSAKDLVFVVATTNFADSLDSALRRPGRVEYVIHVGPPDAQARAAIFGLYDAKYRLGLTVEQIEHLVFRTESWVDINKGIRYTGDHIEAICRGISRARLRNPGQAIERDLLDQIVAQRTKKPAEVSSEEATVIAVHETGHAMISLKLEGCAPVKKISIASEYDGSLGYVLHGESEQRFVQDERQLRAQLVCLMGGRAAERMVFGRVASGGANDIERATVIATHLVAVYGMDAEIGPRLVLHPLIHGDKASGTSAELLRKVEERVGGILSAAEQEATELLKKHRVEFDRLQGRLLKEKVIEF
jgi:cell division protease FtsH